MTPEGHLFFSVGLDVTRIMTDITDASKHPTWYQGEIPADNKMAFTIWNLEKKFGKRDFASDYYDLISAVASSGSVRTDCSGARRRSTAMSLRSTPMRTRSTIFPRRCSSQIGFIDVYDRPYPELTRAARKLGAELYEKRAKGVW